MSTASSRLPRKSFERDARGPLDGVRVLDLSRLVAGNTLTQVLAELGADDAAYSQLLAAGVACEGGSPAKEEEE